MLKIIVSGCNGHMGQCVVCDCEGLEGVEVVAGFNRTPLKKNCFEVYSDPMSYEGPADVVVDFSNPANLDALLEFCLLRKIPIVLCTTGYSEDSCTTSKRPRRGYRCSSPATCRWASTL